MFKKCRIRCTNVTAFFFTWSSDISRTLCSYCTFAVKPCGILKVKLPWWSLCTPPRRAHLQSFSFLRRHDVFCSVLIVQAPIPKPQANVHLYAMFPDVRQRVSRLELLQPVPARPSGEGGLDFRKSVGKWVSRGNGLTLRWITCKDSLNTSQRTQTASIIKMSRLLLVRKGIDTKRSQSFGFYAVSTARWFLRIRRCVVLPSSGLINGRRTPIDTGLERISKSLWKNSNPDFCYAIKNQTKLINTSRGCRLQSFGY